MPQSIGYGRTCLGVAEDLTEIFPEGPVLKEDVDDEIYRYTNEGDQDVCTGEVQDEVVDRRLHPLSGHHRDDDEQVTTHRYTDNR